MRRARVTRGYQRHELQLLYEQLRIGDALEFRRRGFSHWAIYIGYFKHNGEEQHCVIHRSLPEDSELSETSLLRLSSRSCRSSHSSDSVDRIGSIQIDSIAVAFGHDPNDVVLINNGLDLKWPPFEPEEIIARALSLMNSASQEPYNLLTNNCEHFVTRCRYGRQRSGQIVKCFVKVGTTIAGVAASMAWRSSWKAALPTVLGVAAAAGITVSPVVVAAITAAPTIAAAVASTAPTVAHAIENYKGRQA